MAERRRIALAACLAILLLAACGTTETNETQRPGTWDHATWDEALWE